MARRNFFSQTGITQKDQNEIAGCLSVIILFPIMIIIESINLIIFIIKVINILINKIGKIKKKQQMHTNNMDVQQQDERLRQYVERRKREYKYLFGEFKKNPFSENEYIEWFINYKPIYEKNKKETFKIINEEYEKRLFVDKHYEFKVNFQTCTQKFPKHFIKFNKKYKRYGAISFYGVSTSYYQDYLFFSKNAGDFVLEKIHFKTAYYFNKTNNTFTQVIYNIEHTINYDDIDDIYIFTKSNLPKSKYHICEKKFNQLDIYKNNKLIKQFDITEVVVRFYDDKITMYDRISNTEKTFNIDYFKDTSK